MKRCPKCRRDYFDDSLLFCLDDGTALLEGPAEPPEPGDVATRIFSKNEPATAILSEPSPHTSQPLKLPVAFDKRFLAAGFLFAVIVLGGFLVYRFRDPNISQIGSVAVMPFTNQGGNADLEYLTDGMTDGVIRILSQLPTLKVKARSSIFRYKGKEVDAKTIGRDLGVDAVLIGWVAQRGDQLSLSLELIDTQQENVIWAGEYERGSSELVLLLNEIARDVSKRWDTKLSGTDRQRLEKRPTENTEAYRHYLLGRYEWNKRRKDTLLKAVEHLQKAIEADPNFALAYAALADCYVVFSTYEVAPPSEAYALARTAVEKALELDSTHGEAYATLASINDDYDWNFSVAEENYRKAIDLSPNYAPAHQWYSEYLRMVGRVDEAITLANQAVDLDPVSLPVNLGLGESLYLAGRCGEAIPQYQRTIELDPGFAATRVELARCFDASGNYEQAIVESRKAVELSDGSNYSLAILAYSLGKAGRTTEAQEIISQLEERRKGQFVGGTHLGSAYYAVGDLDNAFLQLDRAVKERSPGVRYIRIDPRYASDFRSDKRYFELLKKIGLP